MSRVVSVCMTSRSQRRGFTLTVVFAARLSSVGWCGVQDAGNTTGRGETARRTEGVDVRCVYMSSCFSSPFSHAAFLIELRFCLSAIISSSSQLPDEMSRSRTAAFGKAPSDPRRSRDAYKMESTSVGRGAFAYSACKRGEVTWS